METAPGKKCSHREKSPSAVAVPSSTRSAPATPCSKPHHSSSQHSRAVRVTPQKRLRAELGRKPRTELSARYAELQRQVDDLNTQLATLSAQGARADLTPEMRALHEYNEVKDLTQMVLGHLAVIEQTTAATLHAKYNLPAE